MLGAALGYGIGKLGQPVPALEVDVLDLQIAGRPVLGLEQQVDAAVAAVGHFAAQARVAGQFGHRLGGHRLLDDAVRQGGVDADQMAVDPDQLPGILEFSLGVARGRQPDRRTRVLEAQHGARVGAVRDHDLATVELDIREEALVATQQAATNEGVGESHDEELGLGPGFCNRGRACRGRPSYPQVGLMPR
jgi:hypothetical protein